MAKSFRDLPVSMKAAFKGDETEENWKRRQDYCSQLADLLEQHNEDVPPDFFNHVKDMNYGILQAATSERTTLSAQACRLVTAIAKTLGVQIHPLLDAIFPALISHCASTKSVAQKSADSTITTIIKYSTYNFRLLHHVCSAFREKRGPPRIYAPAWLRLLMHLYSSYLSSEADRDLINKSIVLGLNDAQVKVRENTRATYWEYAKIDRTGAEAVMDGLNQHAANALRDDPHNPDKKSKPQKTSATASSIAQLKAQAKAKMQKASNADLQASARESDNVASVATPGDSNFDVRLPPKQDERPTLQSASSRSFLNAPVRRPRIVATPMERPSSRDEPTPAAKPLLERPASHNDMAPPHRAAAARPTSRAEINHVSRHPPERPSSRNDVVRSTKPTHDRSQSKPDVPRPIRTDREAERHQELHNERQAMHMRSQSHPVHKTHEGQSVPETEKPTPRPRIAEAKVSTPHLRVTEDKENTTLNHSAEKTQNRPPVSESRKATLVDRSVNTTAKQPDGGIESARRTLASGIERLRAGMLDIMGYRKLKNILDTYQDRLLIEREQYEDLFDLLLAALPLKHEPADPQRSRIAPADHNTYTTLTIITMLRVLNGSYPDWADPRRGKTIRALLVARGHQAERNQQITQAMLDLTALVASGSVDSAAVIEEMVDNLQSLDITPAHSQAKSIEIKSLEPSQPSASMSLGLRTLIFLMAKLNELDPSTSLTLALQDRLGQLAQHCLTGYNSVVKRDVMTFCKVLHIFVTPEERFYSYFSNDADKNLISYYVAERHTQNGVGGDVMTMS